MRSSMRLRHAGRFAASPDWLWSAKSRFSASEKAWGTSGSGVLARRGGSGIKGGVVVVVAAKA